MSDTSELIDFLVGPGIDPSEAAESIQALHKAPLDSIEVILRSLMNGLEPILATRPAVIDAVLRLLQSNLLRQPRIEAARLDPDLVVALYENLPAEHGTRFLLAHCLSIARTEEHLRLMCNLLVDDPPSNWIQVGLILSPLFQHDDWQIDAVFPQLADSIENIGVAGGVIDLANHLVRSHRAAEHPLADRSDQLVPLLAALIAQLEQVEKNPNAFGETPEQVNRVLSEAIALIVSVSDALALIGCENAMPQLRIAMDLSHRRIQTEAAGALARLGDQEGEDRLIELAAEPSARLRVLAYAEELELLDRVDEQYTTPQARAESELALWLAQPGQMAVPPSDIERVDHRLQFWPGFEQPVDCFLFRFHYRFPDRVFSNLGIAGPMVHAMAADLTELPNDDAYAAFAGWQAEHDDIYFVESEHWNVGQRKAAADLEKSLEQAGYESIVAEFLGFFLGEFALIAVATRNGATCAVVHDGLETLAYTTSGKSRPLSCQDVWHIYIGRKMLRTFNG